MYSIKRMGIWRRQRLVSDEVLTAGEFDAIAAKLGVTPHRARKDAYVAASRSEQRQTVKTLWKGEVTSNVAEVGDWIVTNLSRDKAPLRDRGSVNRYVIKPEKFEEIYQPFEAEETEFGPVYRSRDDAEVRALYFVGGLDIKAPWGERQTISSAYLLCNGADVYGNEREAFEMTYRIVD